MASGAATSANMVGNAFISQYYNVLHQSPSVVHRFYTDQSQLSRDSEETVSTQQGIHEKIMSMDLNEFKAEIKSVDSQNSLGGGVMVMVTGFLSCKSAGKRNFVQTFFLAPQEKGYFVLNDVLRYIDDLPVKQPTPYSMANGVAESTVSSVPETDEAPEGGEEQELVPEESFPQDEYVVLEKPVEKASEEPQARAVPEETLVTTVVETLTVTEETTVAPLEDEFQEQVKTTTKLSYASIVTQPGTPAPPKAKPAPVTTASAPAPQPAAAAPPAATVSTVEEAAPSDKAIYISNLPLNISEQEVETEFKNFGQIKPGCTQVRTLRAIQCFAFVEFEDPQSATAAVEASGRVVIGGRHINIEFKRATGSRDRGNYYRDREGGRGYGDREGGRSYGDGGRGYGDRESGGRGYGDRESGGRGYGRGVRRNEVTDEGGFRRYEQKAQPQRRNYSGSNTGSGGNSSRNGRSFGE